MFTSLLLLFALWKPNDVKETKTRTTQDKLRRNACEIASPRVIVCFPV
jgi:hypothetical protein